MNANNLIGRLLLLPGILVTCDCGLAIGFEPQTLVNFQVNPGTVSGNLVEGPDGNLYGTTSHGGPLGNGTIFRVTPSGTLTTIVSDQANPAAGLIVGNDGLLYGMTGAGGPFGWGTAFRMTTNAELTSFGVLDGTNGGNPQFRLALAGDGNFYGVSQEGGTNALGAVFRITPAGVVTMLNSFAFDSNGAAPVAGLTLGPDGQLYGVTTIGGDIGGGTIFKISTQGILTTLHSFQNGESFVHQTALTLGPDGNLYGTGRDGGSADMGAVFRITTNGTFNIVFSFQGTNGASPMAELTVGPDDQLYGTTQLGGAASLGTVFKVTTNGVLTTLGSFTGRDSSLPVSGLVLAKDGNLYGCSQGAVFKVTPDGLMTTVVSLIPQDGINPQSELTLGRDGNFYGTTRDGGTNNLGTIFRLSLDGSLKRLISFDGTNGSFPQSGLTLGGDGNLYGTTTTGGASNLGTVYRMTPAGALTTLFSFSNTNGANPLGGLILGKDGFFYGTTGFGGYNLSFGTVYKITTNGDLTTLFNFHGTDGEEPSFRLIFGNDGRLYGTASFGGSTGNDPSGAGAGSVFSITTNGTAFETLFLFQGTNGSNPAASLVLGPDGNLYGTTGQGGPGGGGTIFRVILAPQFGNITRLFDGRLVLNTQATAGASFRLWTSPDATAPVRSWTMLTNGTFAADGTFSYTDSPPVAVQRYYRLSVP